MLIALLAAAVATAQPVLTDEQYQAMREQRAVEVQNFERAEAELVAARTNRCAAKILQTAAAPGVRYDRGAADSGALDRQPARNEAQLFSTVELKVGGCSLPVIRARSDDPAPLQMDLVPVDR